MLSLRVVLPDPPEFELLDVSVPAPVPVAPPLFIILVSVPAVPEPAPDPVPVGFIVSVPLVVVVESDVVVEFPELLQLKKANAIAINNIRLMVLDF